MNRNFNLESRPPSIDARSSPGRDTPAIRLAEKSADYLSDTDLLSVILGSRLPSSAALEAAREILARSGGLHRIGLMSVTELTRIPNIGRASACALQAAFALATRRLRPEKDTKPKLESPREVANCIRNQFIDKHQEEFHVLLLDTRNSLLLDRIATVGLIDRSHIHAREVFRDAVRESCSRIILAHNHPSGDPSPSPQDIDSTRKLVEAGKIIGIEVLDHVIIGSLAGGRAKDWLSLKEEKIIS